MLDKAKFIGSHNGIDILWYGNHLFAGKKDDAYQTFRAVPPHTHMIFMYGGNIFFCGYN